MMDMMMILRELIKMAGELVAGMGADDGGRCFVAEKKLMAGGIDKLGEEPSDVLEALVGQNLDKIDKDIIRFVM